MKHVWFLRLLPVLPVALLCIAATPRAAAAPEALVRLVAADDEAGDADKALEDVLPLLEKNLRFKHYKLLAGKTVELQTGTEAVLPRTYVLTLAEVEDSSVTVRVNRGRTKLVETRLTLREGRPVILGGFAEDDGTTLILVITLKKP